MNQPDPTLLLAEIVTRYRQATRIGTNPEHLTPTRQHTPPGSRPPINLTATHLLDTRHKPDWKTTDPRTDPTLERHAILPTLESWVRLIRNNLMDENLPYPDLPATATIDSETAFLTATAYWWQAEPYANELVADLNRIITALAYVTEPPPTRPQCPACTGECVPRDNSTWWECTACKTQYTPRPVLMTATDIQAATNIPTATIRSWVFRDRIKPNGRNPRGHALFDLAQVLRVACRENPYQIDCNAVENLRPKTA